MTSFNDLYKKYAILPPPPSDDVEVMLPKSEKLPEIKDLTPEEMIAWEEEIARKRLPKSLEDLERTKELVDIGEEEKAGVGEGTMPAIPKKKADLSPDTLLKMCSQYHDLCRKF